MECRSSPLNQSGSMSRSTTFSGWNLRPGFRELQPSLNRDGGRGGDTATGNLEQSPEVSALAQRLHAKKTFGSYLTEALGLDSKRVQSSK